MAAAVVLIYAVVHGAVVSSRARAVAAAAILLTGLLVGISLAMPLPWPAAPDLLAMALLALGVDLVTLLEPDLRDQPTMRATLMTAAGVAFFAFIEVRTAPSALPSTLIIVVLVAALATSYQLTRGRGSGRSTG